ncbi:hypothetical protein B5F37_05340 [Drancourtella sp. An210]|nr:hypothetical protein B5F37_05340 [Drancourtella sp. An210]
MNTFQLSCFLAVAEYLNFAQAAKQLHVTHPAVSQQIQSLEKELNVKLFQRTTRSVKLTDEGKVFLWDAKQIVAISDRAKKRFDGVAGGNIETLSIGCYNFPCMFLLADTLETLRTIRPELHPRLQEIPFQHIYRMLEEGDLDAVVGFKESANVKINALYKEVAKVPMVCICSGSHSLAGKKELSLCDIKEERLVLFVPPKGMLSIAQTQGQLMGERPPSEFYFCESAEAITVLVKAGYGISVLPDFLVPDTPLISRIPLKDVDQVSFGIYYKSLQGNPALKAFIQCAKENLTALDI